jgi:hypothetical protein
MKIRALTCLALGFTLAVAASAQTGTGTFFGTVTDSSGATAAGATVVVTNAATNVASETKASAAGNYVFTNLRPATYSIRVEAPGFKKAERTGVLLEADQRARIDFALQIGEVREVVTVEGAVNTVDTFSATLKEVVDANRMVDLPLNGRNALQLQGLLPGMVQMGAGSAASGIALNTNLVFSVNGARPNQSSYTLDGGLNMDMYNNLPAAFPNPDALQEFSILQNSYSAVSGRNGGAVVNMVTRSGSNALHFTLYEFLRNRELNARNFFARGVDPFIRNQFGATVGGPVIKNKTFFFVAWEATRERVSRTRSDILLPSALERQGNFSQSAIRGAPVRVAPPETVTAANPQGIPYPNSIIPAARLDPVAQKFTQAFYPDANLPGNFYSYQAATPLDDDQITAKVDHSITDNNRLSVRFFWDDNSRRVNEGLAAFNSHNTWTTQNVTVNDSHVFSPTVVNTATFTYARNDYVRGPIATNPADWKALGCLSCDSLAPAGEPADWSLFTGNGFNLRVSTAFISKMRNYQFIDTLQITRGNHLISLGADVAYLGRKGNEFFQVTPQLTFNGLRTGNQGYGYADFYHGVPITVFQNSPLRAAQNKWTPFLYVNDDWRVRRNLTFNIGLRWEPYLTVKEERDELGAFRPGQQSKVYPQAPLGAVYPGDAGIERGIVGNSFAKFAPRFGFAWDPRGDGKTSVRGGYGIFGDTLRLVGLNVNSINQPFAFGQTTFNPHSLTDPYRNDQATLTLLKSYGTVNPDNQKRLFFLPMGHNSIDPDFTTAYIQQWNLNVQRELPGAIVLTVGYVGSKGTNLFIGQEINPAIFVPGQSTSGNVNARRIYKNGLSTIRNTQSTANSTYHSLQISWNRRFIRGFSLLGSYVWSKSIDTASNDGNSGTANQATNPFAWNLDKGLSDFQVGQRFVTSFLWELPFFNSGNGWKRTVLGGWQINGALAIQDGLPFTVFAGQDRSLAGIGKDRGDVLRPVEVFSDAPRGAQVARYFDTSAQTWQLPSLGTFGTVGRNTIIGPGLINFDTALFKQFRIAETREFELRWEVFNAFNRPNFFNPVNAVANGAFGRLTSARDPRIMQIGAKFRF